MPLHKFCPVPKEKGILTDDYKKFHTGKLANFNHAITEEFKVVDMESEVLITIREFVGVQEYTTW